MSTRTYRSMLDETIEVTVVTDRFDEPTRVDIAVDGEFTLALPSEVLQEIFERTFYGDDDYTDDEDVFDE